MTRYNQVCQILNEYKVFLQVEWNEKRIIHEVLFHVTR